MLTVPESLPTEIVDKILSQLVDSYNEDPSYQWTQLRQLSKHQKRRIEKRFMEYWLPDLSVTQYTDPWDHIDYVLKGHASLQKRSPGENDPEPGSATDDTPTSDGGTLANHSFWKLAEASSFETNGEVAIFAANCTFEGRMTPEILAQTWNESVITKQGFFVRLGEIHLNSGYKGSYIINDTELPGLEVSDDGTEIRFRWKDALTALLREEMFMRNVTPRLYSEGLKRRAALEESGVPSLNMNRELQTLLEDVQMARRVLVRKHRYSQDPTRAAAPHFKLNSERHHKQAIPDDQRREGENVGGCCSICSRNSGPDIFEITFFEESMVPQMSIFSDWLRGETKIDEDILVNLYCQEFGWQCCVATGQPGNASWFEQRSKNDFKTNMEHYKNEKAIGKEPFRWDPIS